MNIYVCVFIEWIKNKIVKINLKFLMNYIEAQWVFLKTITIIYYEMNFKEEIKLWHLIYVIGVS